MSAAEHLQPYQMRLFYTARELVEDYPSGDALGSALIESPDVFEEKLSESKKGKAYDSRTDVDEPGDETLYQDIQRRGVASPIMMVHPRGVVGRGLSMGLVVSPERKHKPFIGDGHHRLAALYDINPDSYVIPDYRN